jgi:hypothetical protein
VQEASSPLEIPSRKIEMCEPASQIRINMIAFGSAISQGSNARRTCQFEKAFRDGRVELVQGDRRAWIPAH